MLKLEKVCKTYRTTEVETRALSDVSLEIAAGEFVAIMGPSGCGKSTLLNVLGLLDSPTSGAYGFFGEDVARLPEARLTALRRDRIGFVFQSFNLIDDLSVAENVEVGLLYRGGPSGQRRNRVEEALHRVGMAHRARHRPQQLSGGQQQRVAVARALVSNPSLILADEPTGNLDTSSSDEVLDIFDRLSRQGRTIVLITHEEDVAQHARRLIRLRDGQIIADEATA